MKMIYVPNIDDYTCFSVLNGSVIRAYKEQVQLNTYVPYTDLYINSHYLEKDGVELIETMPVCVSSEKLTTEPYYRNDFSHILVIFILLSFICFYLPTRIILLLFKKGGNIC